MTRHKSPWNSFKTSALIFGFLFCFSVLPILTSALTASLAFVVQYTPLFSMTTFFGLLLAILFRLQFVQEVPQNTLGVLVNSSGELKDLLAPAKYWLLPGAEQIKTCIPLEPISTQMPLLKLKASDGAVPPLVVIIFWRVRAEMSQLLHGDNAAQVKALVLSGQQKREQCVRDAVDVLIRQYMQEYTAAELQEMLADKLGRPLQDEIKRQTDHYLKRVGLQVDQIEFLGIAPAVPDTRASQNAEEGRKLIASARQKLQQVLQPSAESATPQEAAQHAAQVYQLATQVRKQVDAMSEALHNIVTAYSDTYGPLYRQANPRPDLTPTELARQAAVERLARLQQDAGALGQQAILFGQKARDLPAPPFGLTPAERERLFEVLEAIERNKIKLDDSSRSA